MTTNSHVWQENWNERLEKAQEMLPLIHQLHRKNNVVTTIFGRPLVGVTDIDIIKSHRYARRIAERELSTFETLPIIQELTEMNLGSASVDVGRLVIGYEEEKDNYNSLRDYLEQELVEVVGAGVNKQCTDVVLYGFGRIGRLLARILIAREAAYGGVRLRAIVVRKKGDGDILKRASLLRRDSVHGAFNGSISVDEENEVIWANGTKIKVIYASDPATIDYTQYGIKDAILVDNTGAWRNREGLSQHLEAPGIGRVLLTAPGKGDIKNIVYGINDGDIAEDDKILSAASCTTNGITPVLQVINERYGVVHGHVETAHSFTNDQNLIDNYHKGDRRGRAAGLNMVLTETGAAKAVAKAVPDFEGKLTGNAIRVPTPDVSMAVLNLTLGKKVTRDELNEFLRSASLYGPLHSQIDYVDSPEIVSTDLVGNRHAGIVDGRATIATGDDRVVLYVWYDNEYGYSCQVVRVVEEMADSNPPAFPKA